jgi:hypothetical protein
MAGLKLFLGLPTYGGSRFNTIPLISMIQKQRRFDVVDTMEKDGSLLANSFNQLLITAVERRNEGLADFFLLMHADVVPLNVDGWLNDLMDARRDVKAQVLSVVVPIKDARGITSTAVETASEWAPRRLTMKEIFDRPETFTQPDLLINTGMLLVDLRKNDWIDKVCFTINDAIIELPNGKRVAGVQPEDWDFSRQAKALGATLWATRKVQVVHKGQFPYPNTTVWGKDEDPGDTHK